MKDSFSVRSTFNTGGRTYSIASLPALAKQGYDLERLPFATRILLENLLRREDGGAVDAGDIEAVVERRLRREALLSPTDLVVIPHHGSISSSERGFVEALAPRAAVASAGFANRWRMPRPEIVERWRRSGAEVYDTASDGALSFRLCANSGLELLARERADARRIWHDK